MEKLGEQLDDFQISEMIREADKDVYTSILSLIQTESSSMTGCYVADVCLYFLITQIFAICKGWFQFSPLQIRTSGASLYFYPYIFIIGDVGNE